MKQILLLPFLLITLFCSAQNYRFEPQWKKGDTYQVNIVTTTKSFENGVADLDETEILEPILRIVRAEPDFFTMEMLLKNVIQSNLKKISEKYDIAVEASDLQLTYNINRTDGSYKLINFEEAQDFMDKSFTEMKRVVIEKSGDEEAGELFEDVMFPLKYLFSNEDMISQYFGQTLEIMLMPFYKDLSKTEPFLEIAREENPFKLGDTLETNTNIRVESFDENKRIAKINAETEVDLAPFKHMMKAMMGQFAEMAVKSDTSLTASEIEEGIKDKQAEMDEIEMEMSVSQSIIINTDTGWPVNFTQETNVLMNMGTFKNGKTKGATTGNFKKL